LSDHSERIPKCGGCGGPHLFEGKCAEAGLAAMRPLLLEAAEMIERSRRRGWMPSPNDLEARLRKAAEEETSDATKG